jgi:iron complex outermembrane receptor protein
MTRKNSLTLALSLFVAPHAWAAPAADPLEDLLGMSLEELGQVQVTAGSRSASSLSDAPASVFVIHRDDIRLLGIRSLPEALRLAPNLHVAQINASSHAVSARGMKTSLSNKLLVLVDGRPIYTPLFAGVLWDMQAVPMEEIERIEVVSGPGAAAWGANAVNGVINIITRPAIASAGGSLAAWHGQDGGGAEAVQSFAAGDDGAMRVHARHAEADRGHGTAGQTLPDGWRQQQVGFRGDWNGGPDRYTVLGELMRARSSHRAFGPIEVSGHHLLGRWERTLADDRRWSLQAYYDVVDRFDPQVIDDRMAIAAVEFVHESTLDAHHLTWGLGYRHARDDSAPGALARLLPDDRSLGWAHAFVEDRIAVSSRFTVDLGLRLDTNPYTGLEVLPSARFSWRTGGDGLLWGAVSRAVRSPARFDRDFHFPASEPYLIRGGPDFRSEVSDVAEIGYRAQPNERLSFSITGFHHWHDHLRAGAPAPEGGVHNSNGVEGRTYGIEGWATLRTPGRWELAAGFLELRHDLRLKPGFTNGAAIPDQGNDPEHQVLLRATTRIGERQQFAAFARYVGDLPSPAIDSYVQVDARWSFNPTPTSEIGIGVRNLFDERHVELQPSGGLAASEFGRVGFVDVRVGW